MQIVYDIHDEAPHVSLSEFLVPKFLVFLFLVRDLFDYADI